VIKQNRTCLELRREGGEGGGGGREREMTQTMYAHMNKRIKKSICTKVSSPTQDSLKQKEHSSWRIGRANSSHMKD
jgi:hypothetical protein